MSHVAQTLGSKQKLTLMEPETHLKGERVQEGLALLLGWKERSDGAALQRARRFGSAIEAEAYAGFVNKVATRRRRPVTVRLAGSQVVVIIHGHSVRGIAGGITDAMFDLACALG